MSSSLLQTLIILILVILLAVALKAGYQKLMTTTINQTTSQIKNVRL